MKRTQCLLLILKSLASDLCIDVEKEKIITPTNSAGNDRINMLHVPID